jgi:hypothetical protein
MLIFHLAESLGFSPSEKFGIEGRRRLALGAQAQVAAETFADLITRYIQGRKS